MSEIDLFSDLCWDCVREAEEDQKELEKEMAQWDNERMESAKTGGWCCEDCYNSLTKEEKYAFD